MNSPTSSAASPGELRSAPGGIRSALIAAASLAATVASFRTGLPTPIDWLLAATVVAAGVHAFGKRPRHRLRLPADGPARLNGIAGVAAARAVTPLFVSLEVVAPDRRRARAVIFRDELDADAYRGLLVALRNS